MAITTLWLTGFEHQTISGAGAGLFDTPTNAAGLSIVASTRLPDSGFALQLNAAGVNTLLPKTLPSSSTKVIVRLYFKETGALSGTPIIFQLFPTAVNAYSIQFELDPVNFNQVLASLNSSSNSVTSNLAISPDVWYLLEAQIDVSGTTWTMDWKINGVPQTQVTKAGSADTISKIAFGANANSSLVTQYDDVIVGTWVTAATDWYGDGKCLGFKPNACGTHSVGADTFRWTTNNGGAFTTIVNGETASFATLGDWPVTADSNAADDWVDKSSGTTGTNHVTYNYADTTETAPPNGICAIAAIRNASSTTSNSCNLQLFDTGGNTGTIFNTTIGSATTIYKSLTANKAFGSAAWSQSLVNSLSVQFSSTDIAPVPRVKALFLEVDFPLIPFIPDRHRSGHAEPHMLLNF